MFIPAIEALKDGPYLVVATTGGQHTDELRAPYPQGNVVIEDFVDFDLLFEHADAFVCNGGFGSVQLALRHGVPVVGAGTREGKNDINARLAYHGYGVNLRSERPKPRRIARAVARVATDRTIAANVARVRAELESYRPLELIDRRLELGHGHRTSEGPVEAAHRLHGRHGHHA